ncbi:MAG: ComEA family DNA-binding protein [bacterium]
MDWNHFTKLQKIAIAGIILILGIVLVIFNFKSQANTLKSNVLSIEKNIDTPTISATSGQSYFVELTGYVKYPGVYELKDDTMLLELIDIAGGLLPGADTEAVHKDLALSKAFNANQKVYIPGKASNASTTESSDKISINSASKTELMNLPGVGEVTAAKIIENRPYQVLEDLKKVSGIGDATYNKLVSLISL